MIGFAVFLLLLLTVASVAWDYRAMVKRWFIG
jgi:hypothetical protein